MKKLGDIPGGGGRRCVGLAAGRKDRAATPGKPKSPYSHVKLGTAFVHTMIDDHSRVACTEIHEDEKAVTAVGVLRRAASWFAARRVTTERLLPDNGPACTSFAWASWACSYESAGLGSPSAGCFFAAA